MNTTTYTASEARKKLYSLIKSASKGFRSFEIVLRGEEPVVLIKKSELEAWIETLDILSNKSETRSVRKAKKEKRAISHTALLKEIGINAD